MTDMHPTLRASARAVRDDAAALLSTLTTHVDNDNNTTMTTTSDVAVALALAVAALQRVQTVIRSNDNEAAAMTTCVADAKTARRALTAQLRALLPTTMATTDNNNDNNDDTTTTHKRARVDDNDNDNATNKSATTTTTTTTAALDLGQYAHAHVFDSDARRRDKFARLMGGAKAAAAAAQSCDNNNNNNKCKSSSKHATEAASPTTMQHIADDLVMLYDVARTHKGKKGLGA